MSQEIIRNNAGGSYIFNGKYCLRFHDEGKSPAEVEYGARILEALIAMYGITDEQQSARQRPVDTIPTSSIPDAQRVDDGVLGGLYNEFMSLSTAFNANGLWREDNVSSDVYRDAFIHYIWDNRNDPELVHVRPMFTKVKAVVDDVTYREEFITFTFSKSTLRRAAFPTMTRLVDVKVIEERQRRQRNNQQ